MQTTFTIQTNGQGLYEFTDQVVSWVRGSGVLTLFIQHNSASILVQENADTQSAYRFTELLLQAGSTCK